MSKFNLLKILYIFSMAKKSVIERDKKRRLLFNKYDILRKSLKENIKSSINFEQKFNYYSKLQKIPRNSSIIRILRLISIFS